LNFNQNISEIHHGTENELNSWKTVVNRPFALKEGYRLGVFEKMVLRRIFEPKKD
jgi:hypothetical protein